jgi:NADH-quinone oxidoreductase subunit M
MIQLDLIIIAPLVLAAVCAVVGSRTSGLARWFGLGAPLIQGLLLLSLRSSGVFSGETITGAGGTSGLWSLLSDGLSGPLLALTVLVGLMAVSASWTISSREGGHFALLGLLQAAVAAVFLADNIILFYIAWESVLVPMFLLIGGWGSSGGPRAAIKFLLYTFAGGAVLLVGIIYAIVVSGSDSISATSAAGGAGNGGSVVFWLLAIGFLVKLPAVPLHTWLPDAHTEAPTAGSIVLAGVLLKMGGYGLIRIALPYAPSGFSAAAPVLAALGLVGILWGASTALVQTDLKRLVAYSSVAHMGFVLLAVSVATPESLGAALVTMVSHGLVAGLLFYLVGALYGRAHTRELSRFGGLGSVAPRWATAFVFACFASAGLPGLSGFPGEYVALVEAFGVYGGWMLVAGLGVVLAAAYNLRSVRVTVQGPVGSVSEVDDLDLHESATSAVTAALIVVLGIMPWIVTVAATPTLNSVAQFVGRGV